MPYQCTTPTPIGNAVFTINESQPLFVLGANGSGKSSLMHWIYIAHRNTARRISAHRQTWMESGAISLSAQDKANTQRAVGQHDADPSSRWRDPYGSARPNLALFNLLDAENVRAREIAAAVDINDVDRAKERANVDAPLKTINNLLSLSNIPIQLAIYPGDEVKATKQGSLPYSVAELSDGERNAMLVAAEVLTAAPGTLLLIDEPERHLHRSIISPLLNNLFRLRPDCCFVISTHDIDLCTDSRDSQVLLLRGCTYNGTTVVNWDIDVVEANANLPEALKKDVIGARRKVLFIEGSNSSLDHPLYSLIFPGVSIIPKESCRDVEHCVAGIRGAAGLHWVQAWGLVDNDHRTAEDIEKLKADGVFSLDVFSVESIYYHPEIQRRLSIRQSSLLGGEPQTRIIAAKAAALAAIRSHVERLSQRVAEKELREKLMSLFPKREQIAAGVPYKIELDVKAVVDREADRLTKALDDEDLFIPLAHYPIRETPALTVISANLGFQNRTQYESAVLKLLLDDSDALAFTQQLFGELKQEMEN